MDFRPIHACAVVKKNSLSKLIHLYIIRQLFKSTSFLTKTLDIETLTFRQYKLSEF